MHNINIAKNVNTDNVPIPTGLEDINKKPNIWSQIPRIANNTIKDVYVK